MITPGRLWWLFRRDLGRGANAAFHDYFVSHRISRWKNPHASQIPHAVPVYTFCGKDTVTLCRWMLASWFTFTRQNWNVIVYSDGSLDAAQRESLQAFLPGLKLLAPQDHEERMRQVLEGKPSCLLYRERHPLAKKIFDIPTFAGSKPFILLDTDVLFFREPTEILEWANAPKNETKFNSDFAEPSPIPLDELEESTGVRPWAQVNSGLCLLAPDVIDFEFCEKCLRSTRLLSCNLWRVEQTLFALCAAKHGLGGLLPPAYEVSLSPKRRPDSVSRHYVGAVRNLFYGEGMAELSRQLLP